MIVDLADLKAHLDMDPNDDSHDVQIAALGRAAEVQVSQWIGRPIYAHVEDLPPLGHPLFDAGQMVADDAVTVAIKMIARRLFDGPSGEGSTAEDAVPPASVRALLSGHRRFAILP